MPSRGPNPAPEHPGQAALTVIAEIQRGKSASPNALLTGLGSDPENHPKLQLGSVPTLHFAPAQGAAYAGNVGRYSKVGPVKVCPSEPPDIMSLACCLRDIMRPMAVSSLSGWPLRVSWRLLSRLV